MSSSSSPIQCSILGAGLSLQAFHYPFIATYPQLFNLHSVLERSYKDGGESKARAFTGLKDLKVVNNLKDVVEDEKVELVIVSVPNTLHYQYAKECLEAGKHVLMEKPLTETSAQSEELIEIAKKNNLILAPFQNRRWDSDFLAVQDLLREKKLGQLTEFKSEFNRFRPQPVPNTWKETPGGLNDAIYNLGSHLIDQALVLFGKPERVGGWCYNLRAPEGMDDSFLLHLYYPTSHPHSKPYPFLVTLQASIISAGSKQIRYSIKGNKGLYTKYGLDPQEAVLRKVNWTQGKGEDVSPVGKEGWGKEGEGEEGVLEIVQDDGSWKSTSYPSPAGSYQTLYQSLHEAIRNNNRDALKVKPEEACEVIKVIELGIRASKEGKVLNYE